jgi:signal transduction histidine kinase
MRHRRARAWVSVAAKQWIDESCSWRHRMGAGCVATVADGGARARSTVMRARFPQHLQRLLTVIVAFVVWSIPPLLFYIASFNDTDRGAISQRLLFMSTSCFGYAVLTPAMLYVSRRYPVRRVWPHVGIILFVTGIRGTAVFLARAFLPPLGAIEHGDREIFGIVLSSTVVYTATAFVGYAVDFTRRAREREAHLAEARLAMLRAQLNPHFLFNSLNAVAGLVRAQDNGAAVRVLARLSDVLRHVLATSDVHEVALRQELAFINDYVEIERVRFPDRVNVEWCIAGDVGDAKVPSLVLQPLVENALRHGTGQLVIAARRTGLSLVLEVHDDGPGLGAPGAGAVGIGLANTRARLAELYGSNSDLTLRDAPTGGAVATVTLPYHT